MMSYVPPSIDVAVFQRATSFPHQILCVPRSNLAVLNPLEKEMATHSGILAWRIPQTEDPGRLQSMGFQRVGQD